jgi:hypothetical protein
MCLAISFHRSSRDLQGLSALTLPSSLEKRHQKCQFRRLLTEYELCKNLIARVLGQGGEFWTELDYMFRSHCCTRLVLCTSFQHLGDRQFPDAIKYLTLEFRNTNDIVSWIQRQQMVASACQGQAGEEGLRSVFRFRVIWQLQCHAPRKCQIPEYL